VTMMGVELPTTCLPLLGSGGEGAILEGYGGHADLLMPVIVVNWCGGGGRVDRSLAATIPCSRWRRAVGGAIWRHSGRGRTLTCGDHTWARHLLWALVATCLQLPCC
jgi:hypothetical protein